MFLITHDLDTLYTICDRVAVLADKKVLVNAPLCDVEAFDHPWYRVISTDHGAALRWHRDPAQREIVLDR